jgi:hypothetical protein
MTNNLEAADVTWNEMEQRKEDDFQKWFFCPFLLSFVPACLFTSSTDDFLSIYIHMSSRQSAQYQPAGVDGLLELVAIHLPG